MSIITKINEQSCPHCHSGIIKEEVAATWHINGTRRELRVFECGYALEYIPNFSGVRQTGTSFCSRSDAYLNKTARRKEAIQAISHFIRGLSIDILDKQCLINRIHTTIFWNKNGQS